MDAHCSNCATPLTPLWIFCPHCGTAVPHETQNAAPPEHVPARGAFGGLIYGVIAAPILIVAGIMISLTGWGIFLGVPVIVLGILAPLAGPLFGMGEHKGKCPACGTTVITIGNGKVHDCPTCSAKFAVGQHAAAGAR
jgi:zinc ribbon protein